MAEYSRIAKGNFTVASGVTSAYVPLPFQPDYVEIWNYTNIAAGVVDSKVCRAWWDAKLVDGSTGNIPTMIEGYSSSGATIFDVIQTNGISAYYAGLSLQYGATQQIIGITKASQAVVNVTAHGYNVGDTVTMQGIATGVTTNAMRLLNAVPFTIVAVTDANHFTIQWNTNQSNYTAISGSPSGALVKKVLYPFLYLPEDNVISAITTGSLSTVITTTMYHNLETGQEVAFRVPQLWGMTQLNSLPNVVIPGSPIYAYVTSTSGTVNAITLDNWNFAVNVNSSGYTAFTTNPSAVPSSYTYAQVVPMGDVNTGGISISQGSPLYPSPQFPNPNNRVPTINGPAIKGAYVNNTQQGFFIGSGAPTVITAATIVSSASQIYWHAYLHDYGNP
jgi:hypothetical protein